MIEWLRQDSMLYGQNKRGYLQRLTLDFNNRFGQNRTRGALTEFAYKLRKEGRLDENDHAETPSPTIDFSAHLLATPPASPQVSEDVHIEFLDECGVIITVGDDLWYELRCYVCGRNASKNGRFFQGWEGMSRHLLHAHEDLDTEEGEDDIDFILRKCILRQVTATEANEIEWGRHRIDKVKHDDPYGARMVQNSGIVAIPQPQVQQELSNSDTEMATESADDLDFECSICSRSSKPTETPEFCALCGWTVCVTCHGDGDLFGQNRPTHQCTGGDAMETDSQASTILTPSELGRWNSKFAATELAPMLDLLDDFCPCTISGHLCKAIICNKKEICLVSLWAPFTMYGNSLTM